MTLKFQTKKDAFGKVLIFTPAIIMTGLLIGVLTGVADIPKAPVLFGTILCWIFLFVVWNFTYYELKDDKLIAIMGLVKTREISLKDIIGYDRNKYGLWIYGLSKDVLTVKIKNGHPLNISPLDPNRLIKEIEDRKISEAGVRL